MNVRALVVALAVGIAASAPVAAQDLPSVFLEELTWTEAAAAIENGTTTIIIPDGRYGAERPAHDLGQAQVHREPRVGNDR